MPSDRERRTFRDHFSSVAAGYALSRPRYPAALFEWLASLTPGHGLAWDAGTGNGQAAIGLAEHFDRVVATDASAAQVAQAEPHPAVAYRVGDAGQSGLATGSVDLVTAAQAAHWFDLEAFYSEVHRILSPGGVLAIWCYALPVLDDPGANAELAAFADRVGPWWPPERAMVEAGYRTLPFPFDEIARPDFVITAEWTLPRMLSYLRTWSATTRCAKATGTDPVLEAAARLGRVWGDERAARRVRWPVSIRAGRPLHEAATNGITVT